MTKNKKVLSVMKSPEVVSAVKLLIVLMEDIKAKNFISGDFLFNNGEKYELKLSKSKNTKEHGD